MELYLIRHGMTEGNKKKRYIGTTDESLCEEGKRQLLEKEKQGIYKMPQYLFVSPLRRCVETAELLFPGKGYAVAEDFRECSFGEFENKNYAELAGNEAYQAWIDSNGSLPFPGGESQEEFRKRCIAAFAKVMEEVFEWKADSAAMVVHGGTIMSVLERFGVPKREFYSWHVENGYGYRLSVSKEEWQQKSCVHVLERL